MNDQPSGHRVIAFYLPQYHPIPENDAFWGPGFTEWTNVAAARRLYPGHEQPKIPGILGFYDLRLPEVRAQQAALARAHGVAGFMYWHYWFAGHRLLERPFLEVLESGEPDFPFCLGWANASWTGAWHGAPDRVLVEQTYPGEADFEAHFEAVLPALRDRRYLRVDGRPLFLVFMPVLLPDPNAFCSLWRALAERAGLPGLHLVGFGLSDWNPTLFGFDAAVLPGPRRKIPTWKERWQYRLRLPRSKPRIESYRGYIDRCLPSVSSWPDYPVALSNWDNTPRSGQQGLVLEGSTPELFRRHLREALQVVSDRAADHQIVFLKSWNEWAEGNYVEPDRRFGTAYLEVIRDEVGRARLNSINLGKRDRDSAGPSALSRAGAFTGGGSSPQANHR